MVRRSESEWRSLFEAHARSGLKASQFCKENQLNPNYFSTRRQQLLGCSKKKEAAETFVKALPPQVSTVPQGEVRLTVGAASLQFTGVAPEFIAAIVKHLA